jgi:NAD(P)H:quinone oxidoreductase type IV
VTDSISHPVNVLVAYYSATGHVHALSKAVAEGARDAGADVRLCHVEELAPELLISQNQAWGRHRSEVSEEPTATLADLEWADGIASGTPTRFGNVAAQLKMFLDEAGELWQRGELINKVVTAFTSSQTPHGGQESTILALNNTFYHWARSCCRSVTPSRKRSTAAATRMALRTRVAPGWGSHTRRRVPRRSPRSGASRGSPR